MSSPPLLSPEAALELSSLPMTPGLLRELQADLEKFDYVLVTKGSGRKPLLRCALNLDNTRKPAPPPPAPSPPEEVIPPKPLGKHAPKPTPEQEAAMWKLDLIRDEVDIPYERSWDCFVMKIYKGDMNKAIRVAHRNHKDNGGTWKSARAYVMEQAKGYWQREAEEDEG